MNFAPLELECGLGCEGIAVLGEIALEGAVADVAGVGPDPDQFHPELLLFSTRLPTGLFEVPPFRRRPTILFEP